MAQRRINLLPPELAQRRRARQLTATIVAAGMVLVVVLGLVYGVEQIRLNGQQNKLKEQNRQNALLQQDVARLAQFDQLERQLSQRTQLLTTLTADEVRWSVILADVSLVIPSNVWLTNFTGTVSAAVGQTTTAGANAPAPGTIQLTGVTFSHLDVAKWLTRLAGLQEFANPYLSLSSKTAIATTQVVNFNSSVDLSQQAFRRNQRGAERPL